MKYYPLTFIQLWENNKFYKKKRPVGYFSIREGLLENLKEFLFPIYTEFKK